MAYVTCDYIIGQCGISGELLDTCNYKSVLRSGQRRFCEYHHQESLRTNSEYAATVNQFLTDPKFQAAQAAYELALEKAGGANALIFMFHPLDEAVRVYDLEYYEARERQQPGIHTAEAAADEAYAEEERRILALRYDEIRQKDQEFLLMRAVVENAFYEEQNRKGIMGPHIHPQRLEDLRMAAAYNS